MCNTVRTDATNIQKRKGFFMESKRNAQILDIAMLLYVTGTEKIRTQNHYNLILCEISFQNPSNPK